MDTSVVEHELVDAVFEVFEVISIHRVGRHENHRLGFFKPRKWFHGFLGSNSSKGVSDLGFFASLHSRVEEDVSHLAGTENGLRLFVRIHDANFAHVIFDAGCK